MIPLFALTTRGLEPIATAELKGLAGFSHSATSYRRISGEFTGDPATLVDLKTIDDLFLKLADWSPVLHTRDMLKQFQQLSAALPCEAAIEVCALIRTIPALPRFSISASFVGKRNYSSDEIKQACAAGILESTGWSYEADDREADLNVRIFIEHNTATVGIRFAQKPLHERSYKRRQVPGSLKPPVAAALLRMVATMSGERVVDPCCGAGTILMEAAALGACPRGGDISIDAVEASRCNSDSTIPVELWDAKHLPLEQSTADIVACNLPWDRQIGISGDLSDFYAAACAEIERILSPNGRVAILTPFPDLLRFEELNNQGRIEISLFGQRPTIALFS